MRISGFHNSFLIKSLQILIIIVGWINGYDGKFLFNEPGDDYLLNDNSTMLLAPYIAMRYGCATFGILTIVVVYLTILYATKSSTAAFISSVLMVR